MSYIPIDTPLEFDGQTHDPSTGALADADSTPTYAVFQQGNGTAILTGNMTKRSTGVYDVGITSSVANGFTAGKMHQVKMTATVGGVTDTTVLGRFLCVLAWAVTGVPKADVDDWKGSTAPAMTGDAYARLGAPAGASLSADVAAVQAKTTNLPASPAAVGSAMTLTSGERTSVADALLDRADAIETGLTVRGAHRLEAAAAAGVLSGAATSTVVIKNAVANTKTRITATVDSDGDRSAVTTDVT